MPDQKKKIVIIGAGAAGVFTAYLLKKNAPDEFDITILEKNEHVGGNTRGHEVEYEGECIHIDSGAQFFSESSEKDYFHMLQEEGFFSEPGLITETSVGVTIWNQTQDKLLFRVPNNLKDILESVLIHPLNWINFGILTAAAIEKYCEDWSETFGDWIERIPFFGFTEKEKEDFKTNVVRPLMYQFGLVKPSNLDELSAKFVVYYYVGSLPWPTDAGPTPGTTAKAGAGPFQLYTIKIGMDGILIALLKRYGLSVKTCTPVRSIEPKGAGYLVTAEDDSTYEADEVIFGTNPMWTNGLLPSEPVFDDLKQLLSGMGYLRVPVHVQRNNPSYMPSDDCDWSVSNVIVVDDPKTDEASHYMLTVWFGPLKKQSVGKDFFKSWGSPDLYPPDQPVFIEQIHELMVGTPDFMVRRERLRTEFQGKNHIWFAGGYILEYDTQNTCLKAASNVASALIHRHVLQPIADAEGFLMQTGDLPETQFKGRPPLLDAIEKKLLEDAADHPIVTAWKELKKI